MNKARELIAFPHAAKWPWLVPEFRARSFCCPPSPARERATFVRCRYSPSPAMRGGNRSRSSLEKVPVRNRNST